MRDHGAPSTATPEELYYDDWWRHLPKEIQDAYTVLGFNETRWDQAIPPESDGMGWDELPPEMKEAAIFIGYTKEIWCVEVEPTTQPNPPPAQNLQPPTPTSAPQPESPYTANTGLADDQLSASQGPEKYYDEYWKDLPQNIQAAYSVLGYTEHLWDNAIEPASDEFDWGELSPEMQAAALSIGYTEEIWCSTLAPSPSSVASVTNSNTTGIIISVISASSEDSVDEAQSTPAVSAGHYDVYDWVELPPHIQDAVAVLGYDQALWDMDGISWSDDYFWRELPPEARDAAALLGYDEYSWDGVDPITGAAVQGGDDYVSYDDDYLFQVGSYEADIWVSKYQILYFFAALSFLIVGVLDLIRERHAFHILMILAGAFGVLSAIYVEEDVRLSNIFNSLSVHFYLLESITLFGDHKRNKITVEAQRCVSVHWQSEGPGPVVVHRPGSVSLRG